MLRMDELMEGIYREQFEMMGYNENQIEEMVENMPRSEIVVPDNGTLEYKKLLAMVTEINTTQVDTQDKLTDQVYHYDVTDRVFERALSYEDRKMVKEKFHDKESVLGKLEEYYWLTFEWEKCIISM